MARYSGGSGPLLLHKDAKQLPPPRLRTTFEKAIPTKNAAETTSFPSLSAENKYYTILDEDPAPTMTRGGADTAERQHLHASGRVSFLQILILPTPDRNDISFPLE